MLNIIFSCFDLNNIYFQVLLVFLALLPLFYKLQPKNDELEKEKLRNTLLSISSSSKSRLDKDDNKINNNNNYLNTNDCYGPKIVIFSGGTAFNAVAKVLTKSLSTKVTYVLPVSDNGGSSKEIIRVLGGPAIGDIRSRLVRLANDTTHESRAIKLVLEYRLNSHDKSAAKEEMISIVDGSHPIWSCTGGGMVPAISEAYKETVRAFLAFFFDATLRRSTISDNDIKGARSSSMTRGNSEASAALDSIYNSCSGEFDYRGGAIGNFVFTGARLFFRSLEAAIFWFSNLSSIPRSSLVVPVINTNARVTIAALLMNGNCLIGQDIISHPPPSIAATKEMKVKSVPSRIDKVRAGTVALPSPIKKIFYVNQYGNEIVPPANDCVLKGLADCEAIIYGMGSLYTSIIPSLIVPGIGAKIKNAKCPKILMLNGTEDRETFGLKVSDYVQAIVKAAVQSEEGIQENSQSNAGTKKGFASRNIGTMGKTGKGLVDKDIVLNYVTDVLYIDSEEVISKIVTADSLRMLTEIGVKVHAVPSAESESVEDFLSGGVGVIDSLAIINDDDEFSDNDTVITTKTSTDVSEMEGYTAKGKGVDFELLKRFEEQSRNFIIPETEETKADKSKKSKGIWGAIVNSMFGSGEIINKNSEEESRSKHLEFLDVAVSHITGDEKEKRLEHMKEQLKKVMKRQYHKEELIETVKYILACNNAQTNKEYPKEQYYEVPRKPYPYEQQNAFDDDFQYNYNNQSGRKPLMQGIQQTPIHDVEFDRKNIRSNIPISSQRTQYPQQSEQFQNQQYQYSQQEYINNYNQYPSHPQQQQRNYGQQNPTGRASTLAGRKNPSWGKPRGNI